MDLGAAKGHSCQKVPFYDQQQPGPPHGRAALSARLDSLFLFPTLTKKTHICIIYIVLYLNEMCFIFYILNTEKKTILGGEKEYFEEPSGQGFWDQFFQLSLPAIVNVFA
ncbi:hypothetical protein XENOCAPTIV_002336 [Xenoophorus captivus]|uniref:Uncharacterized protein n=1 Tax=Xenoophorus captivus TaxID=1517983 RepID=A0ABV0RPS5_9TELE